MINNFVIVGTIINDIELKESSDNKKYVNLVIEGDFYNGNKYQVPITVKGFMAEYISKSCTNGDKIGIKGYLNGITNEKDNLNLQLELNIDKVSLIGNEKNKNKNKERER